MAEGVGFEPTVGCPTLDFESSALNRTQPPFPVPRIVDVNLNRSMLHRRFSERSVRLPLRHNFLKNVTILGLPRVFPVLHIVCPLDSQRYYLLLTGIHRLLAPLFTTIRT